jgi:beta-glucosidase
MASVAQLPVGPRRRRPGGVGRLRHPGRLTYALLAAALLGSAFPLYWTFVVGSQTNEAVAATPPVLVPGGHFFENAARVFDQTSFWRALVNSFVVSGSITLSVIVFCSLAGFALMAELGLSAYRLSIAWPRVQPRGSGPANRPGLDFYRRLVDQLLDHGIEPLVTLYHWDLPQPLEDAGGWPARDTAARFAGYAELVHAALGDRVRWWTTLNEPWCSAFLGYASGGHAPGVQDGAAALRAAHHLLLGHGLAAQAMRARDPGTQVGITLDPAPITARSTAAADLDAARRIDGLKNRLFLDPLLRGAYPDDMLGDMARIAGLAHLRPGDDEVIAAPLDLLGVNYYRRYLVGAGQAGIGVGTGADAGPSPWPGAEDVAFLPQGRPRMANGWEIDATGLRDILLALHRSYPAVPLLVTENGAAFDDRLGPDGRVHDPDRVRYLDQHVRAVHEALGHGVDVRGYFVWSLLDNFEWGEGYAKRFGIVYVDYPTQRRVPKDSAHWYRAVIAGNGPPGEPAP